MAVAGWEVIWSSLQRQEYAAAFIFYSLIIFDKIGDTY